MIRLIHGPYLLAKLAHQADIFIYIWHTGFCWDRELDYKYLKKKKKKIVCIFVGSDIRSHVLRLEYHKKHDLDTGSNYSISKIELPYEEKRVKKVAADADKYADLIFSYKRDQISYLKSEQFPWPYIYPLQDMLCDISKFDNIQRPIIVHVSSNPVAKGTPLVRAAIKKLREDGYQFEYKEFFDTPNEEVIVFLKQSHILLNQFYAFVPGLLTIEGMAQCNAVLTSASYDEYPIGANNAWFKTTYWEVYDNLKFLLDNPQQIKNYATSGYEFVKHNYTEEPVKKYYLEIFNKYQIIS